MRDNPSRRMEDLRSIRVDSAECESLHEKAINLLRRGKLEESRESAHQALSVDSASIAVRRTLAAIESRRGDLKAAIAAFEDVLVESPDDGDSLLGLSTVLRMAGRHDEATEASLRLAALRPDDAAAHANLGRSLLGARRPEEAIASLGRALDLDPRHIMAIQDRGAALHSLGRALEAAEDFRRALVLYPRSIGAHVGLGNLYLANGNAGGAVEHFRAAASLDPSAPQGKVLLARAMIETGDFAGAETTVRQAIEIAPTLAEAHALLGLILQQCGRFEEARRSTDQALALQPTRMGTFYAAVNGRKIAETDRAWIETMATTDPERLPLEDRRSLHYALGKAFDDLGEPSRAMRHFEEANTLSQAKLEGAGRRFSREGHRAKVDAIIQTFTPQFFTERSGEGVDSEVPVFIVGMARSGTTLLEQILSNHAQVGAAGEQGFWLGQRVDPFHPEEVRRATGEYVDVLARLAPGALRVTDKMPQNFMALGPIHLALPNARIVHCRRSPIDTCLSIFTTSFRAGPDFAHVREDLVFAYREYQRLMAHWRRVLPPERFIEVDYEGLVENREAVARRMVSFLGLPWDESCLRHETNPHPISTPSVWQARQPVYGTSVGRWRRYEPWLGALAELIEPGDNQ